MKTTSSTSRDQFGRLDGDKTSRTRLERLGVTDVEAILVATELEGPAKTMVTAGVLFLLAAAIGVGILWMAGAMLVIGVFALALCRVLKKHAAVMMRKRLTTYQNELKMATRVVNSGQGG